MLDVEQSFERLLGRQPSDKEIQSLYRVKSALDIQDNDALWLVLMALESYDALYRKYPAMISAHVQKTLEEQRASIAVIADVETRKALGTLAQAVSRASEAVAMQRVQASLLQSCGMAMLGLVMFGALCTFVGFVLGSGRLPYWAAPVDGGSLAVVVFSTLARTPAGWLGAIVGATLAFAAIWHARDEILAGHRAGLVAGCALLVLLAGAFLWPVI